MSDDTFLTRLGRSIDGIPLLGTLSPIELAIVGILVVGMGVAPLLDPPSFLQSVFIQFMLFSLLGLGWNLIGGYGGQVALGKSMYFGIGAYSTAMLLITFQIPPWFGLVVGMVISVGWSFMIGYPIFKLRGHYFAITTIALLLVLQAIFTNIDLFHGARGISLPLRSSPNFVYLVFTDPMYYHYLIYGFLVVGLVGTFWFKNSRLGYYSQAIRESEDLSESLGINRRWVKVKVYTLASVYAATGGMFYAVYNGYIDPNAVMSLNLSVEIALMALLGGAASVVGPILGAAVLIPLDRYLPLLVSDIPGLGFLIYGLIIMIITAIEPYGMWALIQRYRGD